jgi:hypothetical protein
MRKLILTHVQTQCLFLIVEHLCRFCYFWSNTMLILFNKVLKYNCWEYNRILWAKSINPIPSSMGNENKTSDLGIKYNWHLQYKSSLLNRLCSKLNTHGHFNAVINQYSNPMPVANHRTGLQILVILKLYEVNSM